MKTNDLFDKGSLRFLINALLLSVGFAVVAVLSERLFGKEAATVVGIGLGAVFVRILQKFEKLRFKRFPESRMTLVPIPTFDLWHLLTALFIFLGSQVIICGMAGLIIGATTWKNYIGHLDSDEELFRLVVSDLTTKEPMWTVVKISMLLSYFVGGLIIGKITPNRRFDAVIGSFTFAILSGFVGLQWNSIVSPKMIHFDTSVMVNAQFCFAFILISYIGTGYGATKQQSPPSTRPKRVKGLKRVIDLPDNSRRR